MFRPDWPQYFTQIAKAVSQRATCPRASVGAVIVSVDNRILATGYNGAPAVWEQCDEIGCDVVDNHCQRAIHAEVNAIGYAARYGVSLKGSRMYIYSDKSFINGPCRECTKVMLAAGVEWQTYTQSL